mgnify:FL=1
MRTPLEFIRSAPGMAGILCVIGGVSCFTTQDGVIKFLSGDYALHQIILIRAVIALIFTLVVFVPFEGGLRSLYTHRLGLHLTRAFAVVMANLFFFTGLATLPLGETVALVFVSPLLITILAVVFLHEKISFQRWIVVGIGMLGTLVMIRPGSSLFNPLMILPLMAALCYAVFQIMSRNLGSTERAASMAFYVQLTFITVSAFIGLLVGDGRFAEPENPTLDFLLRAWVWPETRDLLLLCGIGCLSGMGAYLISQGYRISEASLVAPFEYTGLIFAILWSILFFGDWPDFMSWVGIALIFSAALLAFYQTTNERLDLT